MIGANALLGETIRVELPRLARASGRSWKLASSAAAYPGKIDDDPLRLHDDPADDARSGILSRDGGHFEAIFASGAQNFAEAAGQMLRTKLPGLSFRISIDNTPVSNSHVQLSHELPVLEPCNWTGSGLASEIVSQGEEQFSVSLDVAQRHRKAKDAENGNANDLASLLCQQTAMKELPRPEALEDLVGGGYLALIHADGNGVGAGAGGSEHERAAFFHRNRVFLRRALAGAIDETCSDEGSPGTPLRLAPLIPLMLGGDDLLLVCRANVALPFVAKLCRKLDEAQNNEAQNNVDVFKLTLGIGVVFAKHTIPIHRLHEIAEQLAASSKRRFRSLTPAGRKKGSVIDWAVFSNAWVDDPEQVRRRDWLRGAGQDQRVLSQRPLDVLGDGLDSLQGLLQGVSQLESSKVPRSQLRYLLDQLPRGRALSELAFAELPRQAKEPLMKVGIKEPWFRPTRQGFWVTQLLDLIEVFEIERLGRSGTDKRDKTKEPVHA
jgi:hypothetical protein